MNELRRLQQETDRLRSQVEEENAALAKSVREREARISELESKVSRLEEDSAALQQRVEPLVAAVDKERSEGHVHRARILELEADRDSLVKKNEELRLSLLQVVQMGVGNQRSRGQELLVQSNSIDIQLEKIGVTEFALGVSLAELTPSLRQYLKIPATFSRYPINGILVVGVQPGGPAANRLSPSDVILSVDGVPVSSVMDLQSILHSGSQFRDVSLHVYRKGKQKSVSLRRRID